MHAARFGIRRLDEAQRLRYGHLKDHDLPFAQGRFGYAMTRLNDGGLVRALGGLHAGGAHEKAPYRHCVGGVVSPLVDNLQHIALAQYGGGHLHAAGAPAVRQGHFTPAERHLITRYGHRFEQAASQAALGLLIQVSEVIALPGLRILIQAVHAIFSLSNWASPAGARRSLRIRSSSDWKST